MFQAGVLATWRSFDDAVESGGANGPAEQNQDILTSTLRRLCWGYFFGSPKQGQARYTHPSRLPVSDKKARLSLLHKVL